MLASIFSLSTLLFSLELGALPKDIESIKTDRNWNALPGPNLHKALDRAIDLLGRRTIILAGARIDGKTLSDIQKRSQGADLTRAFREHLRIPIDPEDFLFFLDDLFLAPANVFLGRPIDLSPDRLRAAGILLHPDGVFRARPRKYGENRDRILVKTSVLRKDKRPPPAGALLGPRWINLYQEARSSEDRLWTLYRLNPDFAARMRSLIKQLRAQGVQLSVESTVRDRRRGFLIYGAFMLSRSRSQSKVNFLLSRLPRLQKSWALDIAINWSHPDGWKRTIHEARKMADAFSVTYATENGARRSDHYDGRAIDLYAVGLPRTLRLKSPKGQTKRFDLYAATQSRDLNLTPELIEWIEKHFELRKLRKDYPHWRDARR